jgi:hypothetical protein
MVENLNMVMEKDIGVKVIEGIYNIITFDLRRVKYSTKHKHILNQVGIHIYGERDELKSI